MSLLFYFIQFNTSSLKHFHLLKVISEAFSRVKWRVFHQEENWGYFLFLLYLGETTADYGQMSILPVLLGQRVFPLILPDFARHKLGGGGIEPTRRATRLIA